MKNNKIIYLVIALLLVGAVVWTLSLDNNNQEPQLLNNDLVVDNLEEISTIEKVSDGQYTIIPTESSLLWEARKTLIDNYKNQGTIDVSEGSFQIEEGQIISGSMIIDVNSLKVINMTTIGANNNLEGHLKSDDFFSVEDYPQIELFIYPSNIDENDESSMLYNLEASLTIKGINQNIELPVMVYKINDQVIIEGRTSLDRTLWDIRFGSDKFFDNLANNVIDDFFTITFKIIAKNK